MASGSYTSPVPIQKTGGGKGHNHTFSGSGSFNGTSATIQTMPKYITCYAWYRLS